MAFIEPMHRNKPNITYLLTYLGSDHHPIIITANTSDHPVPERVRNGISKKPNGMHSKINVLLKLLLIYLMMLRIRWPYSPVHYLI